MAPPHMVAEDEEYAPTYPVVPLKSAYTARGGAPTVTHVDPRIFLLCYYEKCMECSFCNDSCCQYGVAIDLPNKERLLAHAEGIAPLVAGAPAQWFKDEITEEPDFVGGLTLDTDVVGRGCVFLRRDGRGCGIHAYTISKGMDYHDLKPFYCSMFPLTCDYGNLVPSGELDDETLICRGPGATLYRGVRDELRYYFGDAIIEELDTLEKTALRPAGVK